MRKVRHHICDSEGAPLRGKAYLKNLARGLVGHYELHTKINDWGCDVRERFGQLAEEIRTAANSDVTNITTATGGLDAIQQAIVNLAVETRSIGELMAGIAASVPALHEAFG